MKFLLGSAAAKVALHNSYILLFVIGAFLGFFVCLLLYILLHKIFFSKIQRNESLKYLVSVAGAIMWGLGFVNMREMFWDMFILLSFLSLFGGLFLFIFAKLIYCLIVPLSIESQIKEYNPAAIRFFKVGWCVSLVLIISIVGAGFGFFMLMLLWIGNYIVFGNLNPFFAFKYKHIKMPPKCDDDDIIDIEIIEPKNIKHWD
ncbi:hypothetical protein BKN38_04660 [Helicobacter sp. CLO-3]|uniref:hypothetical protein n=1 Tax=unclassified Helicobacter TaxID=2593540 RepID=UPI0008057AFB|nr:MULTISPECIES: hypothetical protein [unclassified Helicobacter]OBV29830.1 hypothetical protein BA723_04155 [Helicobacter sp. CLO-3]OHU83980.1 hypothetical protein BKN38_04660 [Helicobacter sp. CLO-3]